jgi:hypothetical protein
MLRCRIESIYSLVEPLSPMALPDALASGFFGFWLLDLLVAVASGADRLGTIDLPLVEPLSPMALPDALASGSFGFRLLDSLVAVASGADRFGTIDLPIGRAIVPNGSARCASVGVFWFLAVGLAGGGGFGR